MPVTITHLRPADHPAVSRLLDDAVGAGFWSLERADEYLSFVARDGAGHDVAGVLLACLAPVGTALPAPAGEASSPALWAAGIAPDTTMLHIRQLAVADGRRRSGIATRLLRRAQAEGRARGASLALAYAWLPAGRPEPESLPFYEAAGFKALAEIPDFYAASSLELGSVCPYCGEPLCRCAARALIAELPAAR